MSTTFKLNTREFDRTLREYVLLTKRDIPTICNTKAYYIARRAVAETPIADSAKIRAYLLGESGRIAGMIINKRRGNRGEKGLYGSEMYKAVKSMLARRLRARAFIKSGWIWAIRKLEPLAEKIGRPSLGSGKPKTYGKPKGSANPASPGWRCSAQIINTVQANWDTRAEVSEIATPALQRAFDHERASTEKYIERKMRERAKQAGIRTN